MIYEVVEYRNCECASEFCSGEKENVLFQHKDKEQCIDFMMKESFKNNVLKVKIYNNTRDKIDIFFFIGNLQGKRKSQGGVF